MLLLKGKAMLVSSLLKAAKKKIKHSIKDLMERRKRVDLGGSREDCVDGDTGM